MEKRIVLCADDYGQAEAISQAIIHLIAKSRLTAATCLVNTPHWLIHAAELKPFQAQIDIGLHFNLSEGKALSPAYINTYGPNFFSLATLLRKAFFRQLDVNVIASECAAQIEYFVKGLGCLPRFVDGHQHIHQFPIIRSALLNTYEKYLRKTHAYIRLVNETPTVFDYFNNAAINHFGLSQCKKMMIYATGAHRFSHLLKKYSIPHNRSFAGIYAFPKPNPILQENDYGPWFQYFLAKSKDGGLIMCHPGEMKEDTRDAITYARYQEYEYLSSPQFLEACKMHHILLSKFT